MATSFKWGFLVAVEMVCTSPVHSSSFIAYLTPLAPLWTFRNHFPPSLCRRKERLCLPVACICVQTFCVSFICMDALFTSLPEPELVLSYLTCSEHRWSSRLPHSIGIVPSNGNKQTCHLLHIKQAKTEPKTKEQQQQKPLWLLTLIQGPLTFASFPCSKFSNFSSHLKFILVRLVLLSRHTNYYTTILSGILVETMFLTPPVKSLPSSLLIYQWPLTPTAQSPL